MRRSIAVAGITVAAIAGGAAAGVTLFTPTVGIAQEATDDTTTTTAQSDGSAEAATPARPSWVDEALDGLVSDGTLTREQADKVVAALDAAAPERGGPGHGHGAPGMKGDLFGAAATALGMEESDLMAALRDGQTIAEVAAEKGVATQTVVDAIVAEISANLDQAVADGRITQDEADERKVDATEKATAIVNGEMPERPEGGMGRHGRHGFGDTDSTDDSTDGTDDSTVEGSSTGLTS